MTCAVALLDRWGRIAGASRAEQHHPLRIDGDEHLLAGRQRIERRATGDERLIAPADVHLGEVALEERLLEARRPHVALACGALWRQPQMHRPHRHGELVADRAAVGGTVDHLPARRSSAIRPTSAYQISLQTSLIGQYQPIRSLAIG